MRGVALGLAYLALAACAPVQQVAIGTSRLDPEIVADVQPAARAETCTLRKRASLPIGINGLGIVPAEINGRPATLILDTGAESAMLTRVAARRLEVTTLYDFQRSTSGIGKSMATGDARLSSLSLGGVALSNPRALVGGMALNFGGIEADGLLGASLLQDFDLDIDVPHRRIDLYDRLECSDPRPNWSGRYATLETTRSLSNHPFFPITINGRVLSATLDTGAQRTVVSARAAASAGLGPATRLPGPDAQTLGVAGEVMTATLHEVRGSSVGGIPLHGPVQVLPAALPQDINALLGFDFLQSNRVWLSYGSRRIFIQPE